MNWSTSFGSVIHLWTECNNSKVSTYSITFSGFSILNISIWSTIWISFSGLFTFSMNNSSIYSASNGSFCLASRISESLSSTTFSGFSCFNISTDSIYSITFNGLGTDKRVNESFSVIKFFHSNGVPYIITSSSTSSCNGSFSIRGILNSSINSISLSGFSILNISIWSTIWISLSGLINDSNFISSIYSDSNGSFCLDSIVSESLSSITFSGLSSPIIWYSFV